MSRRQVLMLHYHFPPLGGVPALRALRFARHLPEFGWDVTVVAPARGDFARDPSLSFPEQRVVRTSSLELSRAGRAALGLRPGQAKGLAQRSALGALRDFVRRWVYLPDAQVGWYPFALAAARGVLRERRIDALFSSAYPMTAHLVARRLRRETRLPWVADFRDLWSDWSVETGLRRRLEARLEASVLAEASAVTTTSRIYESVLAARGARRCELLTNGLDPPEDTAGGAGRGVPDVVVAHLGSYYSGYQELGAAFDALGRLHRSGRVPRVRLRFVGAPSAALAGHAARVGLAERVETTGFLPHAEALMRLSDARLLLVAGPAHAATPAMRGLIPSKVFEYLGTRRPILMIGDPGAEVAELLRRFARARVAAAGDVDGAESAMLELLAMDPAHAAEGEPSLEPYTARDLARRLAALLDSL